MNPQSPYSSASGSTTDNEGVWEDRLMIDFPPIIIIAWDSALLALLQIAVQRKASAYLHMYYLD